MGTSNPDRAQLQAELDRLRERAKQIECLLASAPPSPSPFPEPQPTAEEIQPSVEFTRLVADVNPAVLYLFDLVTERTLYTNHEVAAVVGYSPEQVRALGSEVLPALIHPEDLARVPAHLQQVSTLRDHETLPFECRVQHADGSWRWLAIRNAVFRRDAAGAAIEMIGAAIDITERKHTEEALQASQRFAQSIADISPVVLYIHDAVKQCKTYVNQHVSEVIGYTPQQIQDLGSNLLPTLMHPEDLVRFPTLLGQLEKLSEAETTSFEYRMRHADGSWRWFYSRYAVYQRDPTGAIMQIIGAALDITERKRAEEEHRLLEARIQHAQKLESLGVLAGGIAHDFNNLLTGVLGNASLALRDLPVESPVRSVVQQIETAALRAADLTRQMLAYSGKGRFVVQALNLSRVVEELVNLLKTVISKKAVLRFDLSSDLPAVEADATQVRQVVMNLITNASDAIGERSGIIVLRTGVLHASHEYLATTYVMEELPAGYYAYVEVADTGCGMTEETLQRIFDPFFTTKFTGRGLGLAAVLGIVRGHHGTIKVYSEPGKGTTFKVLLPCAGPSVRPPSSTAPAHGEWRGNGVVLVLDDEESVRTVAKRILELAGFQVLSAADGLEGLELFRRHGPEIVAVLLDLTMPHLSGEEVFRELRLLRPDVSVVLMSGYNEQEVTNLFAGKGLAGFVQKPFRADDLLTVVRQLQNG